MNVPTNIKMQTVERVEFQKDKEGNPIISEDTLHKFVEDGFILIPQLLDTNELDILKNTVQSSEAIKKHAYGRDDGKGRKAKVVLWNRPGTDITGILSRSEKVAGTMEKLLGGEVYQYHSKLIMKDEHTGGMHVWHQDYGYWYNNGCLFPDMGTVFIAIDKTHKNNGCLKVIKGSHKFGRIDHTRIGDQAGIEGERMNKILERSNVMQAEMEPGDALFFHCNVLHRSEQNNSDDRRWAFLCAYNRADNNPFKEHHHPRYFPLEKVPNSRILSCKTTDCMDGKDFFSLVEDVSMVALDPNFAEDMKK